MFASAYLNLSIDITFNLILLLDIKSCTKLCDYIVKCSHYVFDTNKYSFSPS